jgi:glycosyltransferase involved in cell wall biosynthesis
MRVLIATTTTPFVRGGAEILAENLRVALREAGYESEVLALPFKHYPPETILDHMLACRLLDITESCGTRIDLVIGLKFPAYLIPHSNKAVWLLHQHRTAYELWDHPLAADLVHMPLGAAVRSAIQAADADCLSKAKRLFTLSKNVSARLCKFLAIDSRPLYHPPPCEDLLRCAKEEDYFFFPSRINAIKRQLLAVQALAECREPVRIRFAGVADHPDAEDECRREAVRLGVDRRIEWLGQISEEHKSELYARSRAVVYPPFDEDYGYVTLEAMLSSKPVITCLDSGGPLEFVLHSETGLVAEPTPKALAVCMDRLWSDPGQAREFGAAGRDHYQSLGISWKNVVARLID